MAPKAMIGSTNYCKTGTITAGSAVSGLGPTNLAGDQCSPSTGWQTADGVMTAIDGATLQIAGPAAGVTWRAAAVVQTNLTGGATVTFALYLSAGPTLVASVVADAPANGYGQAIAVFDQDYVADYLLITFDDAANPDNHINVGGAFAGPVWIPARGLSWDTSYGSTPQQAKTVSRGGQQYRNLLFRQRTWKITFAAVRNTEAWDSLAELDRIAAVGVNVLLIPNGDSANLNREAVFGPLDTAGDVTFPLKSTDARSWTAQIAERL